jgi:hypothetical protein
MRHSVGRLPGPGGGIDSLHGGHKGILAYIVGIRLVAGDRQRNGAACPQVALEQRSHCTVVAAPHSNYQRCVCLVHGTNMTLGEAATLG